MQRWGSRLFAGAIATLLLATGLVVGQLSITPVPAASAANAADFNPGNIISDAVFYNSGTMTVAQIQSFLNGKVPRCTSGYTCLKDYRETTWSRGGDAQCAAYAGQANESAALIIYKVSTACGINPKVILTTLQKEQGLVTNDWPSGFRYRSAMGYGCPDTAPCDAQYYGFYNQVYKAAWQFKLYRLHPGWYNFVAGRYNTIQWNPNSACGSSRVYITNQATAGLYDYTPYQPNAAALNNLYGTGDGCSSYGNRNFWRIFTDWFGTTQSKAVDPLLVSYYQGGAARSLGLPLETSTRYPDGGVGQRFTNYWVYWSPATGYDLTTGSIGREFDALGGAGGSLGYPTGTYTKHADGGRSQAFQNADMFWSPTTDVYFTTGVIRTEHARLGGAGGVLGYPSGPYTVVAPGRMQKFQNGTVYWSPDTPIQYTTGTIGVSYAADGGSTSAAGFPTGAYGATPDGGRSQEFQNGSYFWSRDTGAAFMATPLVDGYAKVGGLTSAYGYPTANSIDYGGVLGVQLRAGWLYTSAAGPVLTTGAIGSTYQSLGGPKSPLGYPVGTYTKAGDTRSQTFQNGTMYWTAATGAHYVLSDLKALYKQYGGPTGDWGYPTADTVTYTGGGHGQQLQNGWLFWSTQTGGFASTGTLGAYYVSIGGPRSVLGYPIGPYTKSGDTRSQKFVKGTLTWTRDKGVVRS